MFNLFDSSRLIKISINLVYLWYSLFSTLIIYHIIDPNLKCLLTDQNEYLVGLWILLLLGTEDDCWLFGRFYFGATTSYTNLAGDIFFESGTTNEECYLLCQAILGAAAAKKVVTLGGAHHKSVLFWGIWSFYHIPPNFKHSLVMFVKQMFMYDVKATEHKFF